MKKILGTILILTGLFAQTVFALTDNTHSTVLDGSSQYWSITDANQTGLDFTGDMTWSFWVNPDTIRSTTGATGWVQKILGAGNQRSYVFGVDFGNGDADNTWRFAVSDDGVGIPTTYITDTFSLTTGSWQHVVWVYDASAGQIEVFHNGSSEGTATGLDTSIKNGTAEVVIGGAPVAFGSYFDGQMDDVRAWGRTLSSAEISDLYTDPCNFDNGASLQGQWLFDNDGTDETANANDLTNNNSATFSTDAGYGCGGGGEVTPPNTQYIKGMQW